MASADCCSAMRAQEMSGGQSAKRVWYSERRLSFSGIWVRRGFRRWMGGRWGRTGLGVFYVADFWWRGEGERTVFLDVVHELHEVFLRLVWFYEEEVAGVGFDYAVCITGRCQHSYPAHLHS